MGQTVVSDVGNPAGDFTKTPRSPMLPAAPDTAAARPPPASLSSEGRRHVCGPRGGPTPQGGQVGPAGSRPCELYFTRLLFLAVFRVFVMLAGVQRVGRRAGTTQCTRWCPCPLSHRRRGRRFESSRRNWCVPPSPPVHHVCLVLFQSVFWTGTRFR